MNRTAREIYDEILVTRCQRRDLSAWDELVSRWSARLLYYLRRLIGNEHDATSALQEVWLQAIRGMPTLKSGSRLAPWLYTIARRTAMNHFRQEYANREETDSDRIEKEIDDVPDEQLCLENAELVHFGLQQLGLAEREVLTLYFLEDLTIAEIGSLLNVPTGTVKSRLFKARHDLRSILEKESQRYAR